MTRQSDESLTSAVSRQSNPVEAAEEDLQRTTMRATEPSGNVDQPTAAASILPSCEVSVVLSHGGCDCPSDYACRLQISEVPPRMSFPKVLSVIGLPGSKSETFETIPMISAAIDTVK